MDEIVIFDCMVSDARHRSPRPLCLLSASVAALSRINPVLAPRSVNGPRNSVMNDAV